MKDPIERQAIINELESWLKVEGYSEGELNIIKAVLYELQSMPSAQPERKPGRWITKLENNTYECSECGNRIITNKDYLKKHKFCFCCGAKLRGEQDE